MTKEELARFALVLREAEHVRMRMAKDEAAARANGRVDSLAASAEEERFSTSRPAAASLRRGGGATEHARGQLRLHPLPAKFERVLSRNR